PSTHLNWFSLQRSAFYPFKLQSSTPPRLRLIPGLLPSEEAYWTFSKLLAELPWSRKTNLQTGYINSHDSHVSKLGQLSTFSITGNLYRNSKHSIVWHSDDEATLVTQPIIASFSLGDKRAFSLRKQPPPEGDYSYMERLWIPRTHGILLMMERATQDDRQHSMAKEYHDRGPRINLTFCTMYPEPEGQIPGTGLPSPNNCLSHTHLHT
uniref:AlkB homolog 3, alpha-ketoglutarate dependent dioxygenase n=1 Tax=Oncorhynchus kisutch TaxID=8019 RepID=A0A8C7DNH3_ONCKI